MLNFNFNNHDLYQEASDYWNNEVKKFRRAGIITGIVMLIVGILCLIFPFDSAYVMEMLASIVILAIGIAEIVNYVRTPVYLRFGGVLANGILNIILGIMLITSPAPDLMDVFGFMFAIDLIAVGIGELSYGNRLGYFGLMNTGWLTANGVINLIAGILFLFIPTSSAAVLSIVVAIFMITGGISLLVACRNAKEWKKNDDDVIDIDVK